MRADRAVSGMPADDHKEPLQRPIMAFHIGITGHRSLPDADTAALRTQAAGLFRAARAEALALHAASQSEAVPIYAAAPPLLRCICGLAEGADSILAEAALDEGWELVAVLPFAPDQFAQDFEGAALDRYRRLLASADAICALDGDRATDYAYADIGDQIVEQADLLLAIWDGHRAQGPGGTGDVVRHALSAGLPVAVLPPSDSPVLRWLGTSGDGDLAALLRSILLPPESSDGFPQACFADRPRSGGWAAAVLRAYDRLVTLGYTSPAMPAAVARSAGEPEAGVLNAAFRASDQLATQYAARYRAAGLLRYGLILPATLASLVGWYGAIWLQPIGNFLDFILLLFVVIFSTRGGWEPAHRRFLMYRALAEYFRNARLLTPLRAVALMPGAAAHEARAADWTSWYGRAVVRQQGMLPVCFDAVLMAQAVDFVRSEAGNQVRFLQSRAARFDAVAGRLRRVGVVLSIAGVAFSGGRAALLIAGAAPSVLRGFNELALVLPAMAPVFLGLLSFNEYSKLATRYRSVAAALDVQIAAVDRARPNRAAVLPVARRIVEVMLAERDDWRQLMQARTISAY
jgi:hypothetical protein